MAHSEILTYNTGMEKREDETARRIAHEIESGSVFGEQAMRSLGIHPADTTRRKQRRRATVVAAVGIVIILFCLWLA